MKWIKSISDFITEGNTMKAYLNKDKDVKVEEFRNTVKNILKSNGLDWKQIGDDFEVVTDKTYNIMFRPDYIGIKVEGSKFTDKYDYSELGKIKKAINNF